MKHLLLSLLTVLTVSCNLAQSTVQSTEIKTLNRIDFANTITADELKTHLYIFAGDEMEGRMTGEKGQKLAAEYLRNFYMDHGFASPIEENNYYQHIPASYFSRQKEGKDSENIVAFIEGSEKPDEIIVISAHYDHVGMDEEGNIYNGADDDGSGTIAILEIAQAFQEAAKNGQGPKRSVLFLHVTGEEIGLYGSRYYSENPLFPLENTVCRERATIPRPGLRIRPSVVSTSFLAMWHIATVMSITRRIPGRWETRKAIELEKIFGGTKKRSPGTCESVTRRICLPHAAKPGLLSTGKRNPNSRFSCTLHLTRRMLRYKFQRAPIRMGKGSAVAFSGLMNPAR